MNKIQEYLESDAVTKLAQSTQELYQYSLQHLEEFLKEYHPLGTSKLECLSLYFEKFAKYLDKKNLSGQSKQRYITCVKIFMKWAGHPVQDFVYKMSNKERQQNKRKHLDRWFEDEDIQVCLDYKFSKHNNLEQIMYQILIRLFVETGARVGELAKAKREDFHEDYIVIHGKTEPRPVFFTEETKNLIDEYFCSVSRRQEMFPDERRIKAVITDMLKDLGLKNGSDGRGPHTFRHYNATKLFYDGNMDIETIAFLLGDKVETIREHYLHPTISMLRSRVTKARMNDDAVKNCKFIEYSKPIKIPSLNLKNA